MYILESKTDIPFIKAPVSYWYPTTSTTVILFDQHIRKDREINILILSAVIIVAKLIFRVVKVVHCFYSFITVEFENLS